MAWMLWVVDNLDVSAIALSFLKAGSGAIGAFVCRSLWRIIVGESKRCKIVVCTGVAVKRGLCLKCYSHAKKKVDNGETTWKTLVDHDLCDDDKSEDPFNDAYNRAMEDN